MNGSSILPINHQGLQYKSTVSKFDHPRQGFNVRLISSIVMTVDVYVKLKLYKQKYLPIQFCNKVFYVNNGIRDGIK